MKICFNLIFVFCSLNDNLSSMYLEEDQIKDDIINTTLVDYYESFSKFSKAVEVDHKKTGFENQHKLYLNNDKADSDVYNCYLDTGDEELVRTKNKELKEFESYIFEEFNFKNKEPNRNKTECLSFVEIQNNHIFEVMDHEDVNFSNSDDINLSIDQPELNIDLNAEDYLVQVNPLVKTSLCNFSNVQSSNIPECDVDLNKTKYIDIYNDIDDISNENHSNSDFFYNYTTYTDEMSQLDTNTISRLVDNIESFESETFKEQNILNFTLTTQEPANQELSRTRKFTNITKLHSLDQKNRLIDLNDKTHPFLEFYKDLLPENETYNLDQYTSPIPSEYGIVDLEKDCKNTNASNSFTTYDGFGAIFNKSGSPNDRFLKAKETISHLFNDIYSRIRFTEKSRGYNYKRILDFNKRRAQKIRNNYRWGYMNYTDQFDSYIFKLVKILKNSNFNEKEESFRPPKVKSFLYSIIELKLTNKRIELQNFKNFSRNIYFWFTTVIDEILLEVEKTGYAGIDIHHAIIQEIQIIIKTNDYFTELYVLPAILEFENLLQKDFLVIFFLLKSIKILLYDNIPSNSSLIIICYNFVKIVIDKVFDISKEQPLFVENESDILNMCILTNSFLSHHTKSSLSKYLITNRENMKETLIKAKHVLIDIFLSLQTIFITECLNLEDIRDLNKRYLCYEILINKTEEYQEKFSTAISIDLLELSIVFYKFIKTKDFSLFNSFTSNNYSDLHYRQLRSHCIRVGINHSLPSRVYVEDSPLSYHAKNIYRQLKKISISKNYDKKKFFFKNS